MKLVGRILGYTVGFIFFLVLILWLLSPVIIKPVLSSAIKKHGLVLHEKSSLKFNPFASRIDINDLAWNAGENKVFSLDSLRLRYGLRRIFGSEIYIHSIRVKGVHASASQEGDTFTVLGVPIEENTQAQVAEAPEDESVSNDDLALVFRLETASFKDIHLDIHIDGQTQTLAIDHFDLKKIRFDGRELSGDTRLGFALNAGLFEQSAKEKISGDAPLLDIALNLNFSASFSAILGEEMILDVSDVLFDINNVQYRDAIYTASLADLKLEVPRTEVALGETIKSNLEDVYLHLEDIKFRDDIRSASLSQFELSIPNTKAIVGETITSHLNGLDLNLGAFEYRDTQYSTSLSRLELSIPETDVALGETITSHLNGLDLNLGALEYRDTQYSTSLSRLELSMPETEVVFGETITSNLSDLNLKLNELAFQEAMYSASLSSLQLTIPNSQTAIGETIATQANIGLSLSTLFIQQEADMELLSLGDIQIPDLNIDLQQDVLQSRIQNIHIQNLDVLPNMESSGRAFSGFKSLVLDAIAINYNVQSGDANLNLNSVSLDELHAALKINKEGQIAALSAFDTQAESDAANELEASEAADPAGADADKLHLTESALESTDEIAEETAFLFDVGKFELVSPAKISVVDESVNPTFSKQYTVNTLILNNITNKRIDEWLTFKLALKDTDYFDYALDGTIKPFTEKVNLKVNSDIKEFSVQEVSPYLNTSLGFGVEAGQLDSDATLSVTNDVLDGKVKLNLRGAKFSSNKAKQEDELDMVGQAAIPLNVALNMLKDSDGDIKLTIPVSGDVNDPSFGVRYIVGLVVKKAVMSQTKKHLINTFIPYGQVLSVAYSASSYALKVRFEDLPYLPMQTSVEQTQQTFVEQFASLLKKKEDIQVRVCPIAVPSELEDANLEQKGVTTAQKEQLVELARARGAAFKRFVTEQGIESSRLLICSPEIDFGTDSKPRISFST